MVLAMLSSAHREGQEHARYLSDDEDKYKKVNDGGAVMKKGKLIAKIFGIVIVFVMIGTMLGGLSVLVGKVEASPAIIYVPDDYSTIQAAVNAASPGDTVIVRDGTYIENVDVNKDHLTIRSEHGAEVTIVQAANSRDYVFEVSADYVNIDGFMVTGAVGSYSGIYLNNVQHCNISNQRVWQNGHGIVIGYSNSNRIVSNALNSNVYSGINMLHSTSNIIQGNTIGQDYLNISYPNVGILLDYSNSNTFTSNDILNYKSSTFWRGSNNNEAYLNNFINTGEGIYYEDSTNVWHSPEKIAYTYNGNTYTNYLGNYWSDYTGSDADGDGIGETPYPINSDADNYPLMEPFENDGVTGVSLTLDHYLVYQADLSDVEPGKEYEIMEDVKQVIERHIDALGISAIVQIQKHEGEWSIAIQLPGVGETDKVKKLIVRFSLLEFKEQDEVGNWIPATGTVGGKQLILSSRYFKENTYVTVDQYGRPLLVFELDETGQDLFKQISSRLIGKPLAIYLGDEPLRGEDGQVIAPIVETVIEDKGQIQGLSFDDAQELSRLLNAGQIPVPLGRWVGEGTSRVFELNVPVYEGQLQSPPLNCAIKLKNCSSEPYLESGMPLCWPVSFIGIRASFNIYVGDSTGDIKRVRFLSDESQDGVVNNGFAWTPWYYWDVSSGDWHHSSKTMTWSFATGGEKEVWAEIEDSVGQTNRCVENIVVTELLPDRISLDDVEISTIISWLTKEWATDESWPVFLSVSLKDSNIMANILLIASKDPVTEYKLVRVKTDPVTDPRDLRLYGILPSTPMGCIKNHVQGMLTEWLTNAGQKLAEKILVKIGSKIVGTALGIGIPASAVSFLSSLIECSEQGYEEPLEGWKAGEDYLIYLPMDLPEGLDLTLKPERGICDCAWATSPWMYCQDCPGQVQGMWKGRISDKTNDVFVDIEETDNWWAKYFKLFSPGELRVYDSKGRVTGLVNGDIRNDIPNSAYDGEDNSVGIFFPTDSYVAEVAGTEVGIFGLQATSIEEGEPTTFTVTGVPTTPGTVYQYTIDWDALSEGEQGVTVQIDSDRDGIFEETKTLHPPIAAFTYSPSNILVNDEISFDASQSSDVDGEIVSYQWDFGDENTSTGEIATNAYSVPGEYLVSLVVVDNDGVVSTQSRTIEVRERWSMPIWGWVIIGVGILVIAVIIVRKRQPAKI